MCILMEKESSQGPEILSTKSTEVSMGRNNKFIMPTLRKFITCLSVIGGMFIASATYSPVFADFQAGWDA